MPASALLAAVSAASLNLCADEYLLLLAKPTEIASVSFLAQDKRESPLWRKAGRYPANRGSLEQVVRTRPTLVMTMGGGGRATSLIARRLGIRSIDLKPNGSIADVAANLRTVARALGEPSRAVPWVRRIQRLRQTAPATTVDTIWLSAGGQTLVPGSAGADWLRLAGLKQRAVGGDRVSLETLLVRPPAVLVTSNYRSSQFSRAAQWLKHPIVRRAKSRRVRTDGRAWTCMGPLLIGEIARLREQMQ